MDWKELDRDEMGCEKMHWDVEDGRLKKRCLVWGLSAVDSCPCFFHRCPPPIVPLHLFSPAPVFFFSMQRTCL